NQRQTLEEAIDELEKIKQKGEEAGLETVVYISMAFGNPYGDEWSIDEVVDAVDLLESYGIKTISLADTVGLATPHQIRDLVSAVIAKYHYLEIGVHLHSRPDQAGEDITAAYDAALATITLNRPEKRNAISFELISDLMRALDGVARSSARVLIVTGAGKAFCSGMDLENLKALIGRSPEQSLEDSRTMVRLFR